MSSSRSLQDRRSFWRSHVNTCEQSSLSKARYCREHQLAYHQFIYWYPKFSSDEQPVAASVEKQRFLPVAIELPAVPSSLQVRLPSGVVIDGITELSIPLIGAIIRQL